MSAPDSAAMLHPHSHVRSGPPPSGLTFTRGEGVYVFDRDGRQYLEGAAGLWCASLGFGNARLAKVAYDAIAGLGYYHTFRGATNPAASELADALLELAPVPMKKVLLQCSGSEANDVALKLVWYYWNARNQPKKRKIISRLMSYHGSTAAGICLTGKPEFRDGYGMASEGFLHTDFPNYYRMQHEGESETAFTDRLIASIDALIQKEGPETIAAFWAEPVMGAGGAVLPPVGYFEKLQTLLERYDILLVADEVICGFGRTGEMWGATTFGMKPDLICCAKALSAGMLPISAVLIGERVYEGMVTQSDRVGRFVHGYTYAGHPASAAVALETLQIYREMELVLYVKSVEPVFLETMQALTAHPLVGDFRGVGLIGGMEIVADKATRELHPAALNVPQRIDDHARARGLILRFVGNRIAFSPPLVISAEEIVTMGAILKDALDATLADLEAGGMWQAKQSVAS